MNKKTKFIRTLGYDLSTTALSVVGRTTDGEEVFVSIPMRGSTTWRKQPAFDLNKLPGLFFDALISIFDQGFTLARRNGVISGSVRQHDMVLLGPDNQPLIPALSWQCSAASREVAKLRRQGAEKIVGRIEERFILPKLLWALKQKPSLESKIRTVMTTGDFIAMQLTGTKSLCSSEALSNGLLSQRSRRFPSWLIYSAGLKLSWFPKVVPSGRLIQQEIDGTNLSSGWNSVWNLLYGWKVVAGLGDNHAGAVGSGLVGCHTIVISAGTSGTVTRACKVGTPTVGEVVKFEYYNNTLLLLMMADCASWYGRFVDQFAKRASHVTLDSLALNALRFGSLPYPETPQTPFPAWFKNLTLGEKARSLQYSIAHLLAGHFKEILKAVASDACHSIRRVVLTGGLTRSQFFCEALKSGIREAGFEGKVLVSNRVGPLANQAATLGALINAMVGGGLYPSLEKATKELCPSREI